MPVVGVADIVKWTGFTQKGSYKAIDRLVGLHILKPMKTGESVYGQKWMYEDYLGLFADD